MVIYPSNYEFEFAWFLEKNFQAISSNYAGFLTVACYNVFPINHCAELFTEKSH